MSFDELQEVTKDPLVPRRLLVEALMAKLEGFEHPERINTAEQKISRCDIGSNVERDRHTHTETMESHPAFSREQNLILFRLPQAGQAHHAGHSV